MNPKVVSTQFSERTVQSRADGKILLLTVGFILVVTLLLLKLFYNRSKLNFRNNFNNINVRFIE